MTRREMLKALDDLVADGRRIVDDWMDEADAEELEEVYDLMVSTPMDDFPDRMRELEVTVLVRVLAAVALGECMSRYFRAHGLPEEVN